VVIGASTTDYEKVPLTEIRPGTSVPAWTAPCRGHRPPAPPYVLPCGRVDGIAVWTERDDPDGDGDVHVGVLAGPRLVIVKYKRRLRGQAPGIGSRVRAAGPISSGGSGRSAISVGGFD
jgi:hypothetical protein